MKKLDELTAKHQAATAGVWWTVDDASERPRAVTADGRNSLLGLDRDGMATFSRMEDAAFVVAAYRDMPALLHALRCAQRVISAQTTVHIGESLEALRELREASVAYDAALARLEVA